VRYAVLHKITALGQRAQLTARLVITGVPDGTRRTDVTAALEEAGLAHQYADGGVPWGNHDIRPDGRDGSWPRGTLVPGDAEHVTWDQLQSQAAGAVKRITLRVPLTLYSAVNTGAAAAGESIHAWCLAALRHETWLAQLPAPLRAHLEQAPDPARALEHALQLHHDEQPEQPGGQHPEQGQGGSGQGPARRRAKATTKATGGEHAGGSGAQDQAGQQPRRGARPATTPANRG